MKKIKRLTTIRSPLFTHQRRWASNEQTRNEFNKSLRECLNSTEQYTNLIQHSGGTKTLQTISSQLDPLVRDRIQHLMNSLHGRRDDCSNETFYRIVQVLLKFGLYNDSLDFIFNFAFPFGQRSDLSSMNFALCIVIKELLQTHNDLSRSVKLVKFIRDEFNIRPNGLVYKHLLEYCGTKNIAAFKPIFYDMVLTATKFSTTPDILNEYIRCINISLQQSKAHSFSYELFVRAFTDLFPDSFVFSIPEHLRPSYRNSSLNGLFDPSEVSFINILNILEKEPRGLRKAIVVINLMYQKELNWDIRLCTKVMNICLRANESEMAFNTFNKMIPHLSKDHDKRTISLINHLLIALSHKNNEALVAKVREQMTQLNIVLEPYSIFTLSLYLIQRNINQFINLLYETNIDQRYQIFTADKLDELVTALLCSASEFKVDQIFPLIQLLHTDFQYELSITKLNEAVIHHCELGQFDKIPIVIQLMKKLNISPDRHTYGSLVIGLVNHNKIDEAKYMINYLSSKDMLVPDIIEPLVAYYRRNNDRKEYSYWKMVYSALEQSEHSSFSITGLTQSKGKGPPPP